MRFLIWRIQFGDFPLALLDFLKPTKIDNNNIYVHYVEALAIAKSKICQYILMAGWLKFPTSVKRQL